MQKYAIFLEVWKSAKCLLAFVDDNKLKLDTRHILKLVVYVQSILVLLNRQNKWNVSAVFESIFI